MDSRTEVYHRQKEDDIILEEFIIKEMLDCLNDTGMELLSPEYIRFWWKCHGIDPY